MVADADHACAVQYRRQSLGESHDRSAGVELGSEDGFFWAGACVLLFTRCYLRLPEPKGRTYGELDVLFERNISARKFASTDIDQASEHKIELIPTRTAKKEKTDMIQA